MSKIIVGLTGAAGVGKSAVAKQLAANYGFTRMAFAEPLKAAVRAILQGWGYNAAACEWWIDGPGKERPCPALTYETPRKAMQLLGTEWGREGLGGELWVNHLLNRIEKSASNRIVVDDCRFDNEAEAIIQVLNGSVWQVVAAPGHRTTRNPPPHRSENGISRDLIDRFVVNNFTYDGVAERVRQAAIASGFDINPGMEEN